MLSLSSIASIRKQHNFAIDLGSIPTVEWMRPEEKDYEKAVKQTVQKLEAVDDNIETIIRKPDENMRLALGEAKYLNRKVSVSELRLPSYLPQGKVQIQRDIIRKLMNVAKEKTPVRDINQEIGAIKFQAEWDVNPKIGTVKIDDKEVDLRLRNSLGLFSGYLNACEHEFYKQMLNAQLEHILHYYSMALESAEFRGEKVEPKLMVEGDRFYYHLENVLDKIYYSRARDYLVECRDLWSLLDGNEYTKGYLLRMEDVHPSIKNQTEN
jgi:hypothetical protein